MYKKIYSLLIFLSLAGLGYAGLVYNPMLSSNFDMIQTIEEEDGSPSVPIATTIKVTNGSLTDNADGTVSLATGAGGGGGDLLADGSIPLTADWNAGNSLYDITAVEFKGALKGNADTVTNGVYTGDFPLNQDTTGKADTAGNSDTVTNGVYTGDFPLNQDTTGKADTAGNSDTVTNATFTTALTVDTGTVGLTGAGANTSVLTLAAGASSIGGSNTGDDSGTDDQKIDAFAIDGNNITCSLESDGEATKTADISTTTAVTANTNKITESTSGGDHLTLSTYSLAVDDDFLLNTGDTMASGGLTIIGGLESDTLTDGTLEISNGNIINATTTTQSPNDNSTKLATTAYADTAAAGGGATVALDNLASVQINTTLLSDAADTDSLGTVDAEWLNLYIGDAGKIYLGLTQDTSIERSAANEMTLTATSGVTVESVKMDGGVITGATIEASGNTIDADTGDSATSFFDAGTIEGARLGTFSKSFVILAPIATDDYPVWKSPTAITVTAVHVQCLGGTNIVGQLTECNAEGISCAVCDSTDITATANNSEDDDGTLSNGSIDALDYVGWKTESISGTPTSVTVTWEYTK